MRSRPDFPCSFRALKTHEIMTDIFFLTGCEEGSIMAFIITLF